MTFDVEPILKSLCSEAALLHANDHQKVYSISTPLDAKLAFEILLVFGLDVKVYHQADKPSKLYVTHAAFSAAQSEKTFAGALAYAQTLKQIKLSVESLCRDHAAALPSLDYNIAFLKGQGSSRQIVVQLMPTEETQGTLTEIKPAVAPAAMPSVSGQQPKAAMAPKKQPENDDETLAAGPAVGRNQHLKRAAFEAEVQANSWFKKMGLAVFRKMAANSFVMLVITAIITVLLIAWVMLKGFVCPDFGVANPNKAWYCGSQNEIPVQKQQQRPPLPR